MFYRAQRRTGLIFAACLATGVAACAPADAPSSATSTPPSATASVAAAGITDRYWKLVKLRGQPVSSSAREPHLILKAEDNRAQGSTGCNSFSGTYTLDEATSRISFSQIATTRMFCADGMETENGFTEVLGQADNYSLNGDTMTLNRARMAPLARFEAVEQS